MSVAQCDELRAMAGSVGLAVPKAATLMMSAADTVDQLDAENARLRELVRKVIQFERAGCEGCPYVSMCDVDCLYEPDCLMREDIEQDMRKLGVEVDAK